MVIAHLRNDDVNNENSINFHLSDKGERIAHVYLREEMICDYGYIYSMNINSYSTDETLAHEDYMDREAMFIEMELNSNRVQKFIYELGDVIYSDNFDENRIPTMDDMLYEDGYFITHKIKLVAKKNIVKEIEKTQDYEVSCAKVYKLRED